MAIIKEITQAIVGIEHDYTKGSISRSILILAIPVVIEMLMESIFAVVDIYFVARLGAGAVAVVGITESLMTVIYSIAFGLSMAVTALVSRRIGEKDMDMAANSAFQAILLSILISLLLAIPSLLFTRDILALMGADEEIIASGYQYTAILLGSNLVIIFLFVINAIFRSAGDAVISMLVLVVANLINIILDPLLIFGIGPFPELGLTGAAIATTIGRGVGVCIQFYILFKGNRRIKLALRHLKMNMHIMLELLKLSVGGVLQNIIATTSWVGLMRIMATYGNNALAGYTISIRIFIFTLLPSWGISNAASTLVGQNLGAEKPERAERSVWITSWANVIFLSLMGFLLYAYAEPLTRKFISDNQVVEIGVKSLRIICFGYPFYAFGMVMTQAFNGAGDTFTPSLLNFFCFWLLEIPLAYFLAKGINMHETGVFWSITFSESLLGLAGVVFFMRGRWKKVVV